jgi:transcriptional regulator with XRE-family HTH domain
MTIPRKKGIPNDQLETIGKIANLVRQLRQDKKLSIESFCFQYRIPRITYGNLESGRSGFQITTLLTILNAHGLTLGQFVKKLKDE